MRFVIAVPEFVNTGPVNGMAALANALSSRYRVDFCSLRGGDRLTARLNQNIRLHDLGKRSLSDFVARMGEKPVLISCCFSADLRSVMAKGVALKVISVRGNLFRNYRYDYGIKGVALAAFHLGLCRFCDIPVAMNFPMAKQIRMLSGKQSFLLPNFIDEHAIEPFRIEAKDTDCHRIVYVGSLSRRKAVDALVSAMQEIRIHFPDLVLDIVGDGPERSGLEKLAGSLELPECIRFHGFVDQPAHLVAGAAAFVLPSFSEGYSRAALEALYLGVPSVLRNVDANTDLVTPGENGGLFDLESDLAKAVCRTLLLTPQTDNEGKRRNLLPESFRQHRNVEKFLAHIQSNLSERMH